MACFASLAGAEDLLPALVMAAELLCGCTSRQSTGELWLPWHVVKNTGDTCHGAWEVPLGQPAGLSLKGTGLLVVLF